MAPISKAQIKLIRSLQHKKFRDELGLFVAEGHKCIEELKKGYELVIEATSANSTPTEIVQMSGLKTPQGEIAVFKKKTQRVNLDSSFSNLTLVLDGIQDPGNLGTIIRTCDWFGVRQIVCSPDTADCYNPKVVQATMGSIAHVPITYCNLVELLSKVECPIYGTLLDGEDIYQKELQKNGIIVMGNEGNGISQEVRPMITHRLLIPNFSNSKETAESLNVAIATAITCSEFKRR